MDQGGSVAGTASMLTASIGDDHHDGRNDEVVNEDIAVLNGILGTTNRDKRNDDHDDDNDDSEDLNYCMYVSNDKDIDDSDTAARLFHDLQYYRKEFQRQKKLLRRIERDDTIIAERKQIKEELARQKAMEHQQQGGGGDGKNDDDTDDDNNDRHIQFEGKFDFGKNPRWDKRLFGNHMNRYNKHNLVKNYEFNNNKDDDDDDDDDGGITTKDDGNDDDDNDTSEKNNKSPSLARRKTYQRVVTEEVPFEEIKRNEMLYDQRVTDELTTYNEMLFNPNILNDATVNNAIGVIRPYVNTERYDKIVSILRQRTKNIRFLFESTFVVVCCLFDERI
jgi:hypothetical protein